MLKVFANVDIQAMAKGANILTAIRPVTVPVGFLVVIVYNSLGLHGFLHDPPGPRQR